MFDMIRNIFQRILLLFVDLILFIYFLLFVEIVLL